jgi:hypothetical protein
MPNLLKFILEDPHHLGVVFNDESLKAHEVVFELSEEQAKFLVNQAVMLHGLQPAEPPKLHVSKAKEQERVEDEKKAAAPEKKAAPKKEEKA